MSLEPRFQAGEFVEILEGDFVGRVAQIGQSAAVEGKYQYGLTGITETEGNLYAVHEHEIKKSETPVAEEVIHSAAPAASSESSISTGEHEDVSSLLQKASQVAQGRELNFNQTLQSILARLDVLDQRLETKEIKVIVEVQHIYPEKPDTEKADRVRGGYFTSETGKVKWHNDMPATYSDEDRLYDPIEEIVDKARARISNINGNMLQVKDDEDHPQLNMDLFNEGEE